MNIIYDARHIKNVYSGLARYTYSLLNALLQKNSNNITILLDSNENYSDSPIYQKIIKKVGNKVLVIKIDAPLFKFKHHRNVSRYVNSSNCDIFFYPHFDSPLCIKKNVVFVIHDLLPLIVDDYIIKFKIIKKLYMKFVIRRNLKKKNSRSVAVSQSTKNDIIAFFGNKYSDKISVVLEDTFDPVITTEDNGNVSLVQDKKFLLYIGDRRPHKNLKKMIDVFRIMKLKLAYQGIFVIAGSTQNYDLDIEDYINEDDSIELIGNVSDVELTNLYKKMDALFFISKYEGFGLPVVEAAKLNRKIITSSTSSLLEVAPPSALILDPNEDETQMAEKIVIYLTKKVSVNNLKFCNKFSWVTSVKHIFETNNNIFE